MSDISFRKDSDLEKLRKIIVGDEHGVVKELHDRITDTDKRSHDVAEILPQAIQNIQTTEDQIALGKALSNPLETAVKLSIKRNPKTFSDLLYPVILPSIRRAVNEMLRAFVERIDRTISERFSLKSLRWRIESLRTGIPYSEILLRNSILYSVEQALLIHRESGLLIQHAHTESAKQTDSDAVSGMLMAIEQFVQDSFVENDELLQRVTIGEHMVYLVDGPYALLACVVHGLPPASFLEEMQDILEHIHATDPDRLRKYSGDRSELNSLRPFMDKCLQVEYKKDAEADDSEKYQTIIRLIGWLLGGLLLFLVGYWIYTNHQQSRVNEYVVKLNQQPGIKILNHYKDNGKWYLEGLRDPKAQLVALPEESFFLNPNNIEMNLSAFQGMDKSIVLDRAIDFLKLPDSLESSLDGTSLRIKGTSPVPWYIDAVNRESLPVGIRELDLSSVNLQVEEVRAFLNQVLQPPAGVSSRVTESGISYSGMASYDWINSLNALAEQFSENITVDSTFLHSLEQNRLLMLMSELSQKTLDFQQQTILTNSSEKVLLEVAMTMAEIERLAALLEKKYQIVITGYTDEIGAEILNQTLRRKRAEYILERLKLYGVNHEHLMVEPDQPGGKQEQYRERQVGFLARLL